MRRSHRPRRFPKYHQYIVCWPKLSIRKKWRHSNYRPITLPQAACGRYQPGAYDEQGRPFVAREFGAAGDQVGPSLNLPYSHDRFAGHDAATCGVNRHICHGRAAPGASRGDRDRHGFVRRRAPVLSPDPPVTF
jgi:hypothetical protein